MSMKSLNMYRVVCTMRYYAYSIYRVHLFPISTFCGSTKYGPEYIEFKSSYHLFVVVCIRRFYNWIEWYYYFPCCASLVRHVPLLVILAVYYVLVYVEMIIQMRILVHNLTNYKSVEILKYLHYLGSRFSQAFFTVGHISCGITKCIFLATSFLCASAGVCIVFTVDFIHCINSNHPFIHLARMELASLNGLAYFENVDFHFHHILAMHILWRTI